MANTEYDFAISEASSSATGGVNTAEGQDPSTVNDGLRAWKQLRAARLDDEGGVVTVGGTGDVITVTLAEGFTAYGTGAGQIDTGAWFRFPASAANTTNVTLNINTIGAKAIRKISGGTDVALAAGDLAAGETYTVIYRASANSAAGAWVLVGLTSALTFSTRAEANAGTITNKPVPPAYLYFPTGHLWGLTLSNGTDATNDINTAVGTCRDQSDTVNMIYAAAMGKQLDVNWAAGGTTGSPAGGRYSGAAITDTTYHMWAVCKADGANPDFYFDPSAVPATVLGHLQAETGGSAYLYVRRVGSIVRTSAAIKAFVQDGNRFTWASPSNDIAAANPGTSAVTRTLTLPLGIRVLARLGVGVLLTTASTDGSASVLISDLSTTDATPSAGVPTTFNLNFYVGSGVQAEMGAVVEVMTNTSAQVRSRVGLATSGMTLYLETLGWDDTRGRV